MKKQHTLVSMREAARQLDMPFGLLAAWIKADGTIRPYPIGKAKGVEVAELRARFATRLAARKQGAA